MQFNKKILKAVPALLYFAFIWYISSRPIGIDITKFDKLFHIIEYAIMGFLLSFSFELDSANIIKKGGYCLLIAVLTGAADEIHQCFVPWRCGSWWDLGADVVGCLIGIGLWLVFLAVIIRSKANGDKHKNISDR